MTQYELGSDIDRVLLVETIMHSAFKAKEISYDVVHFNSPVNVSEVRLIPPSMFLSTSNGGFVLGATRPEKFKVQFFVNNLNDPAAEKFEDLGTLDYDETGNMDFKCSNEIWSDRLIVSGKFLGVTIVVLGSNKTGNEEQQAGKMAGPIIQRASGSSKEVKENDHHDDIEPTASSESSDLQANAEN